MEHGTAGGETTSVKEENAITIMKFFFRLLTICDGEFPITILYRVKFSHVVFHETFMALLDVDLTQTINVISLRFLGRALSHSI